eukprot:scaffold842_cov227-Pinguiococcus_pyrenoidosus.AAC.8
MCAAIYDPAADEMFWAEKGKGAFLNDDRISVGPQGNLCDGLVCAGSPPNIGPLRASVRGIAMLTKKSRCGIASTLLHLGRALAVAHVDPFACLALPRSCWRG